MASQEDIDKIRKKLQQKVKKQQDPHEFRPDKAKTGATLKYRFYILPPVNKGDKVFGGIATRDMEVFFVQHGQHWVNNKPFACPRILTQEECEMCAAGFALLDEIPKEEKEKRAAIVKQWLSQSNYTVNIYFPAMEPNPVELHDKVLWYNGSKTSFDQWYAAINRDDGGDPTDPEAYGVFYDPNAAFLYQLEAKKKGDYNEYKSSKFLASSGVHPIAMLEDGTPDEEKIQQILDSRHDLFTKIAEPNPQTIHKLYSQMMDGAEAEADEEIPAAVPDDEVQLPTRGGGKVASAVKSAPVPKEAAAAMIEPAEPAVDDLSEEAPVLPKKAVAPATKAVPKPAAKPVIPAAAPKVAAVAQTTKPAPAQVATKTAPVQKPAAVAKPATHKPIPSVDDDTDDLNELISKLQSEEDDAPTEDSVEAAE